MAKVGKQGAAASTAPVRRVRRSRGKNKQRSGLGKAWDYTISQVIRENKANTQRIEARLRREAKNRPQSKDEAA